jgi:mRNA-degrading endonuclease RelE of RelBE toxin-antitoxin system
MDQGIANVESLSLTKSRESARRRTLGHETATGRENIRTLAHTFSGRLQETERSAKRLPLRIGDYRVLYVILKKDEILVFKIARRETAYN